MENNKDTISFEVFTSEGSPLPQPTESKSRGKDYVNWGEENDYPVFLKSLYDNSATHQTIVDGVVSYVLGQGVLSANPQLSAFFKKVNRYGHTINDVCELLQLDIEIYGGCAIQVINSAGGGLAEIYHMDMNRVRVNEFENKVYFSKEWKTYMKDSDIKIFPEFISSDALASPSTVYYFKGNKTRGYYPIPHYNGAIKAIQVDCSIMDTHLNDVENGFAANTLVNLNNGVPEPEQKKEIERKFKNKFNGKYGSKTVIMFNNGPENKATIDKIDSDDTNERFVTLRKNVKDEIFTAHRVTSPALFGVRMEGTGFSKTEYFEAFEIFNETVIKKKQNTFLTVLNQVFGRYFDNTQISITPFIIKGGQNGNI